MRIKIISILFVCLFLLSTFASAQNDSARVIKIKSQTVELGKLYEVIFPTSPVVKGKLIAVNKYSFLMMINNALEEINISDITRLKEIEGENIVYTAKTPHSSAPVYSLSVGYLQKVQENSSSYYYYSDTKPKMGSFDIQGDALIKTSDNFGFRIDINYIHIFGKTVSGGDYPYYYSYDTATYRTETEYKAVNAFTAKTGICFGSMNSAIPFNFYMFIGLGFGWIVKENDVYYSYKTKNNNTTVTTSPTGSTTGFMVGVHGQIRLSYKVKKDYSLFIEPTFQYWGNKTDQLYGINGGITFHL